MSNPLRSPALEAAVAPETEAQSPCIDICVLHRIENICIGCLRTGDEIANWSSYTPQTRTRIMAELEARAPRLKKRRGGRAAPTTKP